MRGTPVVLRDFAGGINTKEAVYNLADNEARDARNVGSTARGSIIKRNGDTAFATVAGSFNFVDLFPVQTTSSGKWLIAVDDNNVAYKIDPNGTATAITGTLTTTRNAYIEAPISGGQGPIYINNASGTPDQWTGSGNIAAWTASAGTLPSGAYMVYFGNRVWVAGNTSKPNRLYFSGNNGASDLGVGDPRNWTSNLFVDINADDNDVITGLGTVGPYLLVFKRRHIYVVYDLDTGANRVLSSNVGCTSWKTIAESPYGTFFQSLDQGVFVTNGVDVTQVSQKITPTINASVLTTPGQGVYFNDHYYLSLGITTAAGGGAGFAYSTNIVLDYDIQLKAWWFHTNPALAYAVWLADGTTPALYRSDATNNAHRISKCYVPGTYQDNGSNFTAYWKSPWVTYAGMWRRRYIPEPYMRKRVRQLRVDGTGQVDVSMGTDFAASSLIQADVFSAATTQTMTNLYNLGVGRAFTFELSALYNAPFELDCLTMAVSPRTN